MNRNRRQTALWLWFTCTFSENYYRVHLTALWSFQAVELRYGPEHPEMEIRGGGRRRYRISPRPSWPISGLNAEKRRLVPAQGLPISDLRRLTVAQRFSEHVMGQDPTAARVCSELPLGAACVDGRVSYSSLPPLRFASQPTNRSSNNTLQRARPIRRTQPGTSSSGPSARSFSTGRVPVISMVWSCPDRPRSSLLTRDRSYHNCCDCPGWHNPLPWRIEQQPTHKDGLVSIRPRAFFCLLQGQVLSLHLRDYPTAPPSLLRQLQRCQSGPFRCIGHPGYRDMGKGPS